LALALALGAGRAAAGEPGAARPGSPLGLLLAISELDREAEPPHALSNLTALVQEGGAWRARQLRDPESNVFHKALPFSRAGQPPLVLTLAGMDAAVKLWRPSGDSFVEVRTLWRVKFGGPFDRIRDGECTHVLGVRSSTQRRAARIGGLAPTKYSRAKSCATCRRSGRAGAWWRRSGIATRRRSS
jgi:hypothetical protein